MLPRHRLGLLVLLLVLSAGLVLRLAGFRDQILGGDELHLVRAIGEHTPGYLLTHFETSDYCQPMAALYRWMSDRGVVLDELWLRLLPLVSGIALCLLAALWGVRRWGWLAGVLFAGLVSLHPLLVYYSRIARPYMVVVLGLSVATVSMERLLSTGRPIWIAPLAISGGLAIWFHIGVAPFAAALCVAGMYLGLRQGRRALLLTLAGSAILAVLVALAVLPSLDSLRQLLAQKSGARAPGIFALWESLQLLLGTPTPWLPLPLGLLCALGGRVLWQRSRHMFWLVAAPLLAQTISLWAFRPDQMHQPVLLARYQLAVVPALLLAMGMGVRALAGRGAGWRVGLGVVGVVFALTHPHLDARFFTGGLQGQADHARFTRPSPRYPEDALPAFYRQLGTTLPGGVLMQTPWQPTWNWNRPFVALAAVHGQPILAAPGEELLFSQRFRWRNFVAPDAEEALASRARYLVLHLDLAGEIVELAGGDGRRPSLRWRQGSREPSELGVELEAALGEPILRDDTTVVWDLDARR